MVHALPNNSRFTGTCQANAERWIELGGRDAARALARF